MKQIQMMKGEGIDFVPAEFIDMELHEIGVSSPGPLNQRMRVELEWCTMFHGFVIDPVDQLCVLDDSGQRVVVGVVNVCPCL
jgi:hypothetical protein